MPKLPRTSGAAIVKALERLGFVKVRQSGSHVILRRAQRLCGVDAQRGQGRHACRSLAAGGHFSRRVHRRPVKTSNPRFPPTAVVTARASPKAGCSTSTLAAVEQYRADVCLFSVGGPEADPGRAMPRPAQRFGGAGRRPNNFSRASPIAISLRSLPAGPSSSRPIGSLLVAPSARGICKPGTPALLPGSVFWM